VWCSDFRRKPMMCGGLPAFAAPRNPDFLGIDAVAGYQIADIISAS
jgi:hypothetical protein